MLFAVVIFLFAMFCYFTVFLYDVRFYQYAGSFEQIMHWLLGPAIVSMEEYIMMLRWVEPHGLIQSGLFGVLRQHLFLVCIVA